MYAQDGPYNNRNEKKGCGRRCDKDKYSLKTNPVGTLSMKDIKTNHRHSLWKKYIRKNATSPKNSRTSENILSQLDICNLIKGSKMHRRIVNQNTDGASAIDESSDDEEFDPNHEPSNTESEFTDSEGRSH